MSKAVQVFTAAEIGKVVGMSKQSVYRALARISAVPTPRLRNPRAQGWRIDALPAEMAAALRGNSAQNTVRPEAIAAAEKWRDALSCALSIHKTASRADLVSVGLRDFRLVFKDEISPARWYRRFLKVVADDKGRGDFTRLSLYLDKRSGGARTAPQLPELDFRHLVEQIEDFDDAKQPTVEDRAFFLNAAFHWKERTIAGPPPISERGVRRALLRFIARELPALAPSRNALRMLVDDAEQFWRANGRSAEALSKRSKRKGVLRPHNQEDVKNVAADALFMEENVAGAWRGRWESRQLSEETLARHNDGRPRRKSWVPHTVRAAVAAYLDSVRLQHKGPWAAKMAGPYIPRDWSGVQPGDWFTADDTHLNHYLWFEDENGAPRMVRGETLLAIDCRSDYILDYIWVPDHYSGCTIRNLITKVHDKIGLPRKGFLFENGVWKSRLVVGVEGGISGRELESTLSSKGVQLEIDYHSETGIAAAGVQVRHALPRRPRTKPIERLINIIQNMTAPLAGYVGRNEQVAKIERTQGFLSAVRAGREHPGNGLFRAQDFFREMNQKCAEFNAARQEGKRHNGKTPKILWVSSTDRDPLKQLGPHERHLIATHRREVKVRQSGVVIRIGKRDFIYASDTTGRLVGQQMLAYFNPEYPDLLTLSDLRREQFYSVPRIPDLPAMSATSEQHQAANKLIAAHNGSNFAIYGDIKHRSTSTITRGGQHDRKTKEFGDFHNTAIEQDKAQKAQRQREERRTRRAVDEEFEEAFSKLLKRENREEGI